MGGFVMGGFVIHGRCLRISEWIRLWMSLINDIHNCSGSKNLTEYL